MRICMRQLACLGLGLLWMAGVTYPAAASDWPAFRGPQGNGTTDEPALPLHWGPEQNIRWKFALPEAGDSSPIVSAGRVFITCAEDRGQKRTLYCLDRKTGDELWRQTVNFDKVMETHQTNNYCGSTPVSDGDRVVVWHSSAGMHCYDMDGKPLWSRNLGEFDHIWGYGSSPIIVDGKVIQFCGPGERTFLTALDLATGETVWETPEAGGSGSRDGRYVGSWATPALHTVDGREQLVLGLPTRVGAFDPASGELLWWINGVSSDRSDVCYASAMLGEGIGCVMAGYGGPAMGFRLGGSGDMTDRNRLWYQDSTNPRNPQRIGTGIVIDGILYMANADTQGSIECLDLATGHERWIERRVPGGPHWGSMVLAAGRLYVTGQSGVTRVLAPNPDRYELLAENDLGDQSNSTPAPSDGELFLRTFGHVYCVSEP